MAIGTVKFFNDGKGFGFISPMVVARTFSFTPMTPGAVLKEGTKVEFDIVAGKKGPQASNVRVK